MTDPNDLTLPPALDEVDDGGGVGPQNADAHDGGAPDIRAEGISEQVPGSSNWPEWSPAFPTDLPLPPWKAEGRAPTAAEMAASLDEPAYTPGEYRLPAGFAAEAGDESVTIGRAVQSLLWHAAMPAPTGMALLEAVRDSARKSGGEMDDATFQTKVRETELVLKRQLGDEEYTRCRTALAGLFDDLDRKSGGKLADFLDDHAEALVDPLVQLKLLMHAGRLEGRKRRGR